MTRSNSTAAWRALLLGALTLLAGPAAADAASERAGQWLARMAEAVDSLNYEGTFVYNHDDKLETMRIVHRVDPRGSRERLISLNGAPREIIRDDQAVTCILPDARSVVVEKSRPRKPFPGALLEDTRELAAHYELMLLGSDRIADRPARLIGVKPKDSYRYGYRLWLDEQTAMPLKIDLMSEAGEALEQVMFTRLELPEEIPVAALEPAISGEGFTWYRGREMEEGPGTDTRRPSRWTVTRLPPGFKLIEQGGYRLPGSRSPVEHMVFSDMLASVSVYIESQADEERFEGHSRMGAVNAFGTTVDGHPVTVVGEVPEATVTLIGRSVVHRAQGAGR